MRKYSNEFKIIDSSSLILSNTNLSQHPRTPIDISVQEKNYGLEFSKNLTTAMKCFPIKDQSGGDRFDQLIFYLLQLKVQQRRIEFPY